MPSVLPTVSRRRVLLGAAALALLGGPVVAACGSTAPVQDVDALVDQLKRAQSDGGLAGNAAKTSPPKIAAALTVIAAQRSAHAKALTEEITRISGSAPETSTTASTTSPPSSTDASAPPPPPPTLADVIASLQQSADAAALLATQQSGYRAGLLGSIAAACTAAASVALTDDDPRAS